MATHRQPSLKEALRSCYPEEVLRSLAQDAGVQQRMRKVSVLSLFWTLVLGFGTGSQRTLSGLRREFEQSTARTIARSAFYDRFTPRLTAFLKKVLKWACEAYGEPAQPLEGLLAGFKDVVLADSTVIKLHELLMGGYPACRTNVVQAAAKVHLVMSVQAASPRSVRVTSERSPDGRNLAIGGWARNRLLIFDLGYFCHRLFDRIARNGGFFLTRVKANANPTIISVNRRWRGRSIPLVGQKLKDILPHLKREILDVMVEVQFDRRRYAGQVSKGARQFRLVGVANRQTGHYHLYITNIPADRLTAHDVARIYRTRWEIELIFKELKSNYQLDELPSSKPHVIEALIYAALLTLVVSRKLLEFVRRAMRLPRSRTPERLWSRALHACAARLLDALLTPATPAARWRQLLEFLGREAVDPNLSRPRNLGVSWA